ncbi:hypothetical protein B0H13DRAFT_2341584 [Mycena leptocephala]|nr:hypothetical protein B0H13DRAFT_2341584 [Mycena leptocephala]
MLMIYLSLAAIASGKFATVPNLTLANCGATVSYQNLEDFAISSTVFTVVAVSDASNNINGRFLGLGPAALAESGNGEDGFVVTYSV